jgi:hypothetical protein
MMRHLPRPDLFGALLLISFLLPLSALAYIGFFTRYMADDYCYAANVQEQGFIKAQTSIYTGFTGRFSFSFAASAAPILGPSIVPFLPLITLTCWLAVSLWAIYQIALIKLWPRPLLASLIIAELIIFATLNATHHIVQSLYWQTGMLNYVPPLILLTAYVGIICYRLRRPTQNRTAFISLIVASAALPFFAGGFTEAFMLLQAGGLSLAVALCWKYVSDSIKRAVLPLLIAGLVGSLLALCIVVAAPGNSVRQSFFPAPPNLFTLTGLSVYNAAGFIAYTIYLSPLTTLLTVTLPALFGYHLSSTGFSRHSKPGPERDLRLLVLLPAIGFTLIFLCTVPAIYGTSGFLPERARLIPQFVFVCTAVCWGYLVGVALSERLAVYKRYASWPLAVCSIAVTALLILSPLAAARRSFALAARASAGASMWDQMDREVRAARARGEMNVVVPAVPDVESRLGAHRTELQLEQDASNWKNRCAARYYGVNSIRAE